MLYSWADTSDVSGERSQRRGSHFDALERVRWLLLNGADPNIVDEKAKDRLTMRLTQN